MIFKAHRSGVCILWMTFGVYGFCQLVLMTVQFRYENIGDEMSSDSSTEFQSSQPNTTDIAKLKTTPYKISSEKTNNLLKKYHGFMRVDNVTVEAQTFAFSAYFYTEGKGNVVRVIVLSMRQNSLDPTTCQLYGSGNKNLPFSLSILKGNINYEEVRRQDIREHHNKRYAAAYFTCNVPYNMKPVGVSLVTHRCENPSNFMLIQYPEKQRWQFTVCVTPLNFRYSKAYELVEMIEMNRILGADHFVFYNYSTHVNVDKVLQYYIDKDLVEVVQWHLPMKVDVWPKIKGHTTEIHYFGQLGALNDCLYRNRYRSNFLVYQDLDEFIFPYKHQNWNEMIESLPRRGVYMFRNTFFRKDWNDTEELFDGKDLAKKYKSTILLKTWREAKIFGLRQRSKYIINPRKVDTVGIHNVWKERSASSLINVPRDVALMHHYRDWENPHDKTKRDEDQTALKYKDKLLGKLKTVWSVLKDVELGPLGF
ncbi:beta-1,4-galactosyltransferase galt-1-like isoform X3 [Mizuhopecten yessoensis]|uniref:beta-1,4-galactosyltransferase galt-1-like isoform X3 n=1 Tax=Mizuhopecten yessoensis TaxID=6573 RepID=UPI000B458E68|nr:beta-1,4-galactosyltransferase galt-1-like isoform X3 [Mizuhopecten yessoensis]XP_021346515.1 beta-1,4-galactosyltransferase galt-1-like isoform X3 [Mizuhopecten yessoensis]